MADNDVLEGILSIDFFSSFDFFNRLPFFLLPAVLPPWALLRALLYYYSRIINNIIIQFFSAVFFLLLLSSSSSSVVVIITVLFLSVASFVVSRSSLAKRMKIKGIFCCCSSIVFGS